MGNVEYDTSLRLAPNAYQVGTDFWAGSNYGNGLGLPTTRFGEATLANRIGSLGLNTLTPDSFKFPKTHSFSLSFARRIPWNQVAEVSYVGTRGRESGQPQQRQRHALRRAQLGHLQRHRPVEPGEPRRGRQRGHQPREVPPVQRAERDDPLRLRGESNYDSMQVTLSRQTGRRLQYFVAYTLGRTEGTLGGDALAHRPV